MVVTAQKIACKALGVIEDFGLAVLSIKQPVTRMFRCKKRAKSTSQRCSPAHRH
jgi:hypothetical protein